MFCVFCFKQKTAYEMRISDWSSDVCSSDLPTGVVEAHRRPRRGRHAEPLHQRLRAVVADADGDALAVDDGADVVRMDAVEREGDDAGLLPGGAEDGEP